MDAKLTAKRTLEAILKALPLIRRIPDGLEETLERMLDESDPALDRERLNIVLSFWRVNPIGPSFYNYYFDGPIISAASLVRGIHGFVRDALWFFGDIRIAFYQFCDAPSVGEIIQSHEFDVTGFSDRRPWQLVKQIDPIERGYLGYVSGQRPYKESEMVSLTEKVIEELDQHRDEYEQLHSVEIEHRVMTKLGIPDINRSSESAVGSELDELDLFSLKKIKENLRKIAEIKERVAKTIRKVEQLKEIGKANQLHYLRNVEMIDVYVATSMRDDKEYIEMAQFVDNVFGSDIVKSLNLRYFDPTLCFCESRIDKGIIECLLVRTSKVTIYCAQDGDTFGKDSELAATLCQGKPVIVFVPTDVLDPVRASKLDARAKIFQEFHPLSLQVGISDGVARGVIVVRSPEECATILYQILTNSLDVEVHFEKNGHGIFLREKQTKCVVRVMTGWGELAHAFWNNFGSSREPRSGRPL